MVSILIDTREGKLLKLALSSNTPFEKQHLHIGDIHLIKKDKNNNSQILVIERKSIPDLLASIKDGRYKEQKTRLNGLLKQGQIGGWFYLVEGTRQFLYREQIKTYYGFIISSQLRDNIQVIHTNNPKDSWEFIVRLMQRFEKDEFKILQIQNDKITKDVEQSSSTYIESIKAVKKDNITPSNSQAMAFGTIPGVSFKMGEIILKKYKTLSDLFDTYLGLETEEEKEKLLEEIQISEKRKLGKILSARIYNFLFK